MKCTSLRVAGAMNNILEALHASSMIESENISTTEILLLKKRHLFLLNEDYKSIEVKIIMSENDLANLRLYEAFYIRKYKPTLNCREECTEFADHAF